MSKEIIINYKLLIISVLIFISLVFAMAISTPPVADYEISIYDAYPPYFWFLLIAYISCNIVLLICQGFNKISSNWLVFAFIGILFSNMLILLLPIARGYLTLGRGDVLTHIGEIKEIILTGHFSFSNIYPAIHIFVTNLSLITNSSPELLAMLVPIFFIVFYMVSIYFLASEISLHKGQILLVVAFGSLLLFKHENEMLAPSVQCFYLLPFVLFLFFKMEKSPSHSNLIAFILILTIIPFLHPGEGTLLLVVIFICISLSNYLLRFIKNIQIKSLFLINQKYILYSFLILFIIWFSWFSFSSTFYGTFKEILNWMIYGIGKTTAIEYSTLLEKANLSSLDFIRLFLNMFGQFVIYCSVGLIIILYLILRFMSKKHQIDLQQFIFSILFVVFGILLFVAFFSKVWLEYGRGMRYVMFSATILNGLGLHSLFHKNKCSGMILIVAILIVAATFGVFNTYPSPAVREANSQVTRMEVSGMSWFFFHKSESIFADSLFTDQFRFAHLILGSHNIPQNIRYNALPPEHFGYDLKNMYGEYFGTDRYFVDGELSRIFSPSVFPEYESLWKFTPYDFYRLDHIDQSVSKVYSNGGFWVYYVRGG